MYNTIQHLDLSSAQGTWGGVGYPVMKAEWWAETGECIEIYTGR